MASNATVVQPPAPASTSALGLTDFENWLINVGFYMCGGFAGLVTNFLVFLTIVCDKHLRASSFFVEMCIISLNRCTPAAQNVILSVYRLMKTLGLAPAMLDRWDCYFLFFFDIPFPKVDFTFLFFVAVDRIVAIGRPMLYKEITPRRVAVLFGFVLVVGTVCIHVPEAFEEMPSRLNCLNVVSSMAPKVYKASTITGLTIGFLIAVSYVSLVAYILIGYVKLRRVRLARRLSEAEKDARFEATMKRHMDILRPLMIVVVSTSVCVIGPSFLFFFASFSPGYTSSARLVAYAGALTNLDFNVMCWALLTKSSEFRAAFKRRFMRGAIGGTQMGTSLVAPSQQGIAKSSGVNRGR